ncbi:MAG: hypothetical protein IPF92_23985 [Myxococcales bacterium]|jgi:hypothetical protein|nr:hypothetical protein [Myxococcales bacterium]MBL0193400.1 hypothetical protein [Myxococcales bacterium]HQY62935.1 hypothetical protein [Polyangiaceae bacterium]
MRWALAATLFVVSACGSLWLARAVLLRLPTTYFTEPGPSETLTRRIARNVLAGALVVIGLVLALPGVPGQGLLTVVAGLLLADLPGKRRLLGQPRVLGAVNGARERAGVPPILPPNPPP